jgi:hypothetical protein
MASGIGQTHATAILTSDFQNSTFTPSLPTGYMALFTVIPSDTAVGTGETTYGAYTRIGILMTSGNWTVASGTATLSGFVVTFPTSTSGTASIIDAALMAASSGGTQPLYWGDLTAPQTINSGNTPQFNASSIVASMS